LSNFPYVQKQPVLVDFERSVLDEATFAARSGASVHKRDPGRTSFRSRLRRYALGDNEVARRLAVPFIVEVQQLSPEPLVLVLGDTPFMQQVHEGAYDFTRFALSGHRWLF